MSLRLLVAVFASTLTVGLLALSSSGTASAHERRAVGNYEMEVGFLNEPTIANQLNGVFMHIEFFPNGVPETAGGEDSEGEGGGREAVLGADQTTSVTVTVGGGAATRELEFEPLEDPGSYVAPFIPTLPGDYTFHILGEIDGTEIDETFESGPNTFEPVVDPAELEFPSRDAGGDTGSPSDDADEDDDDDGAAIVVAIIAAALAVLAGCIAVYAISRGGRA